MKTNIQQQYKCALSSVRFGDPSPERDGRVPRFSWCARLVFLSMAICSALFGQGQGLSITNYQLVSTQTVQRTLNYTYRASLVNTGTALGAVTAVVTSLNPSIVQVAAGQNTLQFAPVPANSEVTSSNTLTLQTIGNLPVDFSQLQWTFQTAAILLPANVTVTPGDTVSFPVTLGAAAPSGGVYITLASSNPAIATVSPASFFVPEGVTYPRSAPSLTGNSAGSVTITASAPGYASANTQVLVSSGATAALTMSFWPGSLTIGAAETQNLTLNLSAPAPSALSVTLSSSNRAVATTPATVSFGANTTSVTVPVTSVAAGSVTITANAPEVAGATASVTVTAPTSGGILLPSTVTVTPGNTVNFPVALGTAAPASVSITLASSDPAVASVFPSTLTIPEGATSTARQMPAVTGNSAGSAIVTASAPGYATANTPVQVTGGSASTTMSFSPGSLTINGTVTQDLTLNLSAPVPAGLIVSLSSSNPAVATVPAAMNFGTGATLSVPVTGVAAGSATITASATNVAGSAASVTVTQAAAGGILLPSGVTVTPGNTVNFPVALGTSAPAGGVSITLATSNPSIATVSPSTLSIPAGATSASGTPPAVRGMGDGSATVTASAFGYPTASSPVQVTGGVTTPPTPATTMSFSPGSLTIAGTVTQSLTLNLSAPAPAGLVVGLSSSNTAVATVPAAMSFGTGATTLSVPVTGVAAGSVTITASAANIASATATVTVTVTVTVPPPASGTILLTANPTVGLNQSAALQVSLAEAAPTSGVTVSLASSNPSTASVTSSVFIAARNTVPATPPQVNGLNLGSVSITASAPGFTPASASVQVTAGGGSSFLSPAFGLTIIAGSTQNLTLNLSAAPANGLTVSVTSSNPGVATVPATVTANPSGITIPVTGIAAGSVTITTITPNFGTATATVTVVSLNDISVTWYGACWETMTVDGFTGNFQGIDFALSTPTPVILNGTLYFTPNCDPSQGTDNLNDYGNTTGSTHMIQGFIHHPNVIPSSAVYWIGNATTMTGACPPGSLCSGCVTYNAATPNCSIMP